MKAAIQALTVPREAPSLEGAKREASPRVQHLIIQYGFWLKRQGYADSTVTSRVKLLRVLAERGANLEDPESFKEALAGQPWCNKRKMNAVDAYAKLLEMLGKTWQPPKYRFEDSKLPFIPMEAELDSLIASCSPKISAFLQLLKETGVRSGEACKLTWEDVDFTRGTVRVSPEKGSEPRIFKVSDVLLNMLQALKAKGEERLFGSLRHLRKTFERQRLKASRKLGNPRLLQIHFHTFRHWKATMLYHQTRDIVYVMRFLGHKNIKNTLIYIQLEEALFRKQADNYICKVAERVEEARKLIEAGFEYVCEVEGAKLFWKPK